MQIDAAMGARRRPVKLLSADLIHRIAAGEVVDRPASVLKELFENSIDAGATEVKATIIEGGLQSIEVEDNGIGLSFEDLENCVQRHATSKIQDLADLDAINSLGFRGEALSAAASVSRLRIDTFSLEDGAWTLKVLGGKRESPIPGSRSKGTKVSVEDLFFNVPARRKFLKKAGSEADECVEVFLSLALARPLIAFELYVVGAKGEVKKSYQFARANSIDRFAAVHRHRAEVLFIEKNYDPNNEDGLRYIEISAYRPPAASATQRSIRLSINGRAVYDKRLPYALREAFAGLIEIGAFPIVQVNVVIDPALIDVNIHPQKKEIRWPSGFSLAGKVYSLVRPQFEVKPRQAIDAAESMGLWDGLLATTPRSNLPVSTADFPEIESFPTSSSNDFPNQANEAEYSQSDLPNLASEGGGQRRDSPNMASDPPATHVYRMTKSAGGFDAAKFDSTPHFRFRELRVVGEIGAAWIVCESPQGLVLIDQHAAHERINFERILLRKDLIRSKAALVSLSIEVPLGAQGHELILRGALEQCGFELSEAEITPTGTLEIIAMPEADRKINWGELLNEVFREASAENLDAALMINKLRVRLAASLACHGSVRRGQRLSSDSIRNLLVQMDEVKWGAFCPHGRPLWIEFPHEDIEKFFHR